MSDDKNIFYHVWHWLLNKGALTAFLILNIIGYIILTVAMAVLYWITKKL